MKNLISYGYSRVVLQHDENKVIKIPYNQRGVLKNKHEWEDRDNPLACKAYELTDKNWLICELLDTDISHFPRVLPPKLFEGDLFRMKGYQVGLNAKGEYRYFDWADDVACKSPHRLMFHDGLLNLFEEYLKSDSPLVFASWLAFMNIRIDTQRPRENMAKTITDYFKALDS